MSIPVGYEGILVSLLLVCGGAILSGCGKGGGNTADAAPGGTNVKDPLVTATIPDSSLILSSPAFVSNGPIPKKHTCQGDNVSPELRIHGVPAGTKSLVIVVDDPDAPDPAAPKRDWIHWIVFDLPPTTLVLPEGVSVLPAPGRVGLNDWGNPTYGGPCPPIGRHRYIFRVYAIDKVLGLNHPKLADLRNAVAGHVLGASSLIGTYQKT